MMEDACCNIPGRAANIICVTDRLCVDQFGLQQTIPQDPANFDKLHKMDLRGKNEYNLPQKHEVWIQMWENRELCVVNVVPDTEPLYHHSQYIY
ncbi:hypothetical protein Lal_00027150 [Lupinus albus]|nr:hypothetical protein Lal_00027150 [Lupinus albus]